MFSSACDHFLRYLKAVKNSSEHTVRNYSIDLNCFKKHLEKFCEQPLNLEIIDRKMIRGFLAELSAQNASRKTVVRRLSTLRTFFKFALAQKWISHNPTEDLDTPKVEKKIPTSLTYDQVKVLFEQPDIQTYLGLRDRTILELFYSSGLRVSELVGLNREDLDAQQLLIKIRGKGKKERVIPITQNAAEWMIKYLNHPERHQDIDGHKGQADDKAIFLNKLGTRLSTRSVDRNFDLFFKASGIAGNVTPHTIRHTIATHWLENGMDLKTIQLILGHSSPATTTIYTQVSPRLKKTVHEKTHPRA